MYSIWLKHTAKLAGQEGKLLLLLPMIKDKKIKKTAIHVACTYLKQSRKQDMQFSSTLVYHKIASRYSRHTKKTVFVKFGNPKVLTPRLLTDRPHVHNFTHTHTQTHPFADTGIPTISKPL